MSPSPQKKQDQDLLLIHIDSLPQTPDKSKNSYIQLVHTYPEKYDRNDRSAKNRFYYQINKKHNNELEFQHSVMLAKERLAKIGLGVRLKKEVLPPESVKSSLDPIRKKIDETGKSYGTRAKKITCRHTLIVLGWKKDWKFVWKILFGLGFGGFEGSLWVYIYIYASIQ